MENITYDAHCHIFNLKYALKEIKNIFYDVLKGTYHFRKNKKFVEDEDPEQDNQKAALKDTIRKIYELLRAALESEEKNMDFLQNKAEKVFPSEVHKIIPLMMDIFYMFTDELDKGEDISYPKALTSKPVNENEFERQWNEILDDFSDYLKKSGNTKSLGLNKVDEDLSSVLAMIDDARKTEPLLTRKKTTETYPFYQTEGYCYHMNNLKELVQNRKDELFPFVAIDPRRKGIIDYLVSGAFTKSGGGFYGVKLYPRLGYHPQCKPMDKVYAYCSKNKIPIITHCGTKGFPPFNHWDFDDFGNPANFIPALEKYPDLIIDFAHFGIDDKTNEWAPTIIDLITCGKYPNVYTDLACYTDDDELQAKANLINKNDKLKSRVMMGSDFDVVYFAGGDSMVEYYNKFKKYFDPATLLAMRKDNPARFLGHKSFTKE